jgi:phosphatidylinositol kinase/protein kinase (PI-3  family)
MRQDERAMQLFGLANALFARDRRTSNFDLTIQRYNICPLSHDAGLIGFVPNCDTFHTLIKDYRGKNRILLNMESREMSRLSGDYDMLTVMQKVEIFSEALSKTTMGGFDLYEIYWTRSENSEEWLEHRTKYTRSLAVMSMVGYILGLGDRHPSNLMLSQINGGVCHIDFGDCFEVAMVRDKYPERVPFRLTRMLIKAMEISGIEGSFRSTCEKTMTVMRDNKDSLLAMLEAFVYDPLVSWRLLCQPSGGGEAGGLKQKDIGLQQQQDVGLQQQQDIYNTNSQLQQPMQSRSVNDRVLSRPTAVSQGMINEPIREHVEEEIMVTSQVAGRELNGEYPQVTDEQQQAMRIFHDIQSLAASVRATSSRVASIAADGVNSERLVAPASASKSRLGRSILRNAAHDPPNEDVLNEKALKVIRRVQHKLNGTDFHALNEDGSEGLDVEDQVQRLIVQATNTQNLCQLFVGWYVDRKGFLCFSYQTLTNFLLLYTFRCAFW